MQTNNLFSKETCRMDTGQLDTHTHLFWKIYHQRKYHEAQSTQSQMIFGLAPCETKGTVKGLKVETFMIFIVCRRIYGSLFRFPFVLYAHHTFTWRMCTDRLYSVHEQTTAQHKHRIRFNFKICITWAQGATLCTANSSVEEHLLRMGRL